MRPSRFVLLPALLVIATMVQAQDTGTTSCLACHSDTDLFDQEALEIATGFANDVHAEAGLSCHDCHGGNPDPSFAEDLTAMDEAYAENPYLGVPEKTAAPALCGGCHSDPTFMRRFKPDVRVDQEREYWTSQHGMALAQGDTRVATCTDCHGTHGIRRVTDPQSTVYPTAVAETCRSCHGDPEIMEGSVLPDGRPLPVDQYAQWRQSVHATAMHDKEDLTAPTCNDCHGNHGATPPGLDSITFVCGQCHGREASIFRESVKQFGFEVHNEYVADAGADGCAACHEHPEPQAELSGFHSFGECASCHKNHGVVRPTMALLSPLPAIPCHFCHEGNNALAQEAEEPEESRRQYESERDRLLAAAELEQLGGEDLFNWMVDQALKLPAHTLPLGSEEITPQLRPEFSRLFDKFRIGKTYYTFEDPVTGKETQSRLIRCDSCHAAEPLLADEPVGAATAGKILASMQELTAAIARAERILLRARRGGVETRDALLEIDQAVNAQISLEVLIHEFSTAEDSGFMEQHQQGLTHAKAALAEGEEALGELAFRRQGLAVSLLVIGAVLIGLALKIREISAREDDTA